ncbi:MAG: GIY-YIG nuclease family protein [Bacillota bacterium]
MHYVYIVECSDGTYYTGYTTEPARRVEEHNQGEGAKYTRGRSPVNLVYKEKYDKKSKALQREYEIKSLSRKLKEKLIKKEKF